MPTYYVVRDAHKTRGPMDAASARVLLAELGPAGREVAEVTPGVPQGDRVFVPAATHALWTDAGEAASPAGGAPWLTTETAGWPDAERLGIVGADRTGRFEATAALRAEVLAEVADAAAALGADAVVALGVSVGAFGGGGVLVSATGTALRLA